MFVQGSKWLHSMLREEETWMGKHGRDAQKFLRKIKLCQKTSIIGKLVKSRGPVSYGACRLMMLVWNRSLNCAVYSGFLNLKPDEYF